MTYQAHHASRPRPAQKSRPQNIPLVTPLAGHSGSSSMRHFFTVAKASQYAIGGSA